MTDFKDIVFLQHNKIVAIAISHNALNCYGDFVVDWEDFYITLDKDREEVDHSWGYTINIDETYSENTPEEDRLILRYLEKIDFPFSKYRMNITSDYNEADIYRIKIKLKIFSAIVKEIKGESSGKEPEFKLMTL